MRRKPAIQAEYALNVGNLHDTGRPTKSTPPAAKADDLPVMPELSTVASSAFAAIRCN